MGQLLFCQLDGVAHLGGDPQVANAIVDQHQADDAHHRGESGEGIHHQHRAQQDGDDAQDQRRHGAGGFILPQGDGIAEVTEAVEADQHADDAGDDDSDQRGPQQQPTAHHRQDDAHDQVDGGVETAVPMENEFQNVHHAADQQHRAQSRAQHVGGKLRPAQQHHAQHRVSGGGDDGIGLDTLEEVLHTITLLSHL